MRPERLNMAWHGRQAYQKRLLYLIDYSEKAMSVSKLPIPAILPGDVPVGLALPDDLSFEEWREVGMRLVREISKKHWELGDWWVYGEHRYGDRKALIESEAWTGPGFQACMDIAMVCRAFREVSRRREDLSFGHHRTVASLPAAVADRLLDWCEESIARTGRTHSIRELRAKVSEYWSEIVRRAREQTPQPDLTPKTIMLTIVREEQPAVPIQVGVAHEHNPSAPRFPTLEIALDDSRTGGPVPPKLEVLRVGPLVELDRVKIARQTLAKLSAEQRVILYREDLATLPVEQRTQFHAEGAAELGYRLEPARD